jgi:hypothetical protein
MVGRSCCGLFWLYLAGLLLPAWLKCLVKQRSGTAASEQISGILSDTLDGVRVGMHDISVTIQLRGARNRCPCTFDVALGSRLPSRSSSVTVIGAHALFMSPDEDHTNVHTTPLDKHNQRCRAVTCAGTGAKEHKDIAATAEARSGRRYSNAPNVPSPLHRPPARKVSTIAPV